MNTFLTVTADNRVLAIHQTEADAVHFARGWNALTPHPEWRFAHRVVEAGRRPIYARTDYLKPKAVIREIAL